jgi:hypothetical protein
VATGPSPCRLPPHHQDLRPEQPHDEVDERDQPLEIGRVLGPLETPEAEALVKALQLAPAGQVEDDARLARK